MFIKYEDAELVNLTEMTIKLVLESMNKRIESQDPEVVSVLAENPEQSARLLAFLNRLETDVKYQPEGVFLPGELFPYFAQTFDKGISMVRGSKKLEPEEELVLLISARKIREFAVMAVAEVLSEKSPA